MAKIVSRFIIEIAGKPVENVENALEKFKKNFEESSNFKLVECEVNEPEYNEKNKLYSGFLDVEAKFDDVSKLLGFIVDFSPTSIEIVEPSDFKFDSAELGGLLNDVSNVLLRNNLELRKYQIAASQMHKELQDLKSKK